MAWVVELNEYMQEFPGYTNGKELQPDDIMDIAEYGVPAMWQQQMVVHGFNLMDHMVSMFVKFCEHLEYAEMEDDSGMKSKTVLKNGSNGAKLHAKSSMEAQSKKKKCKAEPNKEWFCELHGIYGHSTGECKVILAQAKKMWANWEANWGNPNFKKKESKKDVKEELHTMVKDMVGRALKKSYSGKKHKSEDPPEENFNIKEFEREYDLVWRRIWQQIGSRPKSRRI